MGSAAATPAPGRRTPWAAARRPGVAVQDHVGPRLEPGEVALVLDAAGRRIAVVLVGAHQLRLLLGLLGLTVAADRERPLDHDDAPVAPVLVSGHRQAGGQPG